MSGVPQIMQTRITAAKPIENPLSQAKTLSLLRDIFETQLDNGSLHCEIDAASDEMGEGATFFWIPKGKESIDWQFELKCQIERDSIISLQPSLVLWTSHSVLELDLLPSSGATNSLQERRDEIKSNCNNLVNKLLQANSDQVLNCVQGHYTGANVNLPIQIRTSWAQVLERRKNLDTSEIPVVECKDLSKLIITELSNFINVSKISDVPNIGEKKHIASPTDMEKYANNLARWLNKNSKNCEFSVPGLCDNPVDLNIRQAIDRSMLIAKVVFELGESLNIHYVRYHKHVSEAVTDIRLRESAKASKESS